MLNLGVFFWLQNGYASHQKDKNMTGQKRRRKGSESYEEPSLFTAFLTSLGFYILMFLGYVSSLLFTPKIAQEKNREVS